VIQAVERALGRSLDVEYHPGRPTDATTNVLDASKALKLLNWSATTDFDDAIRRTAADWPLAG
jgi:nucleoside-diphosphate-sugar epimerase